MGQRQVETGRLAITCWDYAWPLGPAYGAVPGAVEARLDEAVARGFNAVRLDPYPHLLATPANSVHLDHCEILAEPDRRRGLSGGAVTVPIRKAFQRLLNAAAERDLKLWLSGFFLPDSRARRSFVRRPGDFVDVWVETLELIRRWGRLDTVVAVDFATTFPSRPGATARSAVCSGNPPTGPCRRAGAGSRKRRWNVTCWKCPAPCVPISRTSTSGSAPPPPTASTCASWTPASWIFWIWGCGWTTTRASAWPPAPICRCPACSAGA